MLRKLLAGVFASLLAGGAALAQSNTAEFTCFERSDMRVQTRVVGALYELTSADVPWMVNLSSGGRPFCGGSLINERLVITAAHCMIVDPASMVVRTSAEDGSPYGEERRVVEAVPFEGYEPNTANYDVALLSLDAPIELRADEFPLLVPAQDADYWAQPDDCAQVMGWGRVAEGGPASAELLAVNVPIWANEDCGDAYGIALVDEALCAGYRGGVYDACNGDSGGPLIIRGGPTGTLLVGVVSWGDGCARENRPGVYTRVSSFRDWVFAEAERIAPREDR